MRWAIEVDETGGDQRLVEEVLAGVCMQLTREDGQLLMVSPRFETLDSGAAVHELARKVRDTLKDVALLQSPQLQMGLTLGRVVREYIEGRPPRKHVFLEVHSAVILTSCGSVEITRGGSWTEEDRLKAEGELKERDFQRKRADAVAYLRAGLTDRRVLDVMRLLHDDISIQDLGHVVEIIEDDMGRGISDLASGKQLERFNRSINHPGVFGVEARHAVSPHQRPPEPMGKDEAVRFVRNLVERWVEFKNST